MILVKRIGKDCIDCKKCIEICSEGALWIDKDTFLLYDDEICINCEICIEICDKEIIKQFLDEIIRYQKYIED